MSLLFSPLREFECSQGDLADGAILVDVRIRGRAKQAGHMIERAWWFRKNRMNNNEYLLCWSTSLYSERLAINLTQYFKCVH